MRTKKRIIDIFLNCEIRIGSIVFQMIDILFIMALWAFGLLIRIELFPILSADYWGFLEDWMNQIKALGGFTSLGTAISNYTSPYMYLMCLVSGFDNSLYALKAISVFFDYAASIAIFLIVYEITKSTKKSILGMALLILCPTVIIDSAYWCQCDIIYTCFLLYALYFFFKDNSKMCWIMVGVAFAFKLQTLFFVPFLIIMWLKKKTIKLFGIVYLPIVYVIAQLPAWMFGRSFKELMTIYVGQSGYYPWGTLEYPNLYALLDETIEHNHHMYELSSAGTWMTMILLGFIAYYIYTKRFKLNENIIISLALLMQAVIVYTLPHMHDRYGFFIDLLAIIYCVLRPKKLPVLFGFMLVSVMSFMPYLTAVHLFPIERVAVLLLGLIVYVGYDLYCQLKENEMTPEEIEAEELAYMQVEETEAGDFEGVEAEADAEGSAVEGFDAEGSVAVEGSVAEEFGAEGSAAVEGSVAGEFEVESSAAVEGSVAKEFDAEGSAAEEFEVTGSEVEESAVGGFETVEL